MNRKMITYIVKGKKVFVGLDRFVLKLLLFIIAVTFLKLQNSTLG